MTLFQQLTQLVKMFKYKIVRFISAVYNVQADVALRHPDIFIQKLNKIETREFCVRGRRGTPSGASPFVFIKKIPLDQTGFL